MPGPRPRSRTLVQALDKRDSHAFRVDGAKVDRAAGRLRRRSRGLGQPAPNRSRREQVGDLGSIPDVTQGILWCESAAGDEVAELGTGE